MKSAPRMSQRLIKAIAVLDDGTLPIAEINRRLGALADELALPRPSYASVRRLVLRERQWNARRGPSTADVLLDIAFRARPPTALLDHITDDLPRLPDT